MQAVGRQRPHFFPRPRPRTWGPPGPSAILGLARPVPQASWTSQPGFTSGKGPVRGRAASPEPAHTQRQARPSSGPRSNQPHTTRPLALVRRHPRVPWPAWFDGRGQLWNLTLRSWQHHSCALEALLLHPATHSGFETQTGRRRACPRWEAYPLQLPPTVHSGEVSLHRGAAG